VPGSALSVITRHVELDKTHVEEELVELDYLLERTERESYFDTLHIAMRTFELYLTDLYESHRAPLSEAPVAAE
jgi:hypothetical protein